MRMARLIDSEETEFQMNRIGCVSTTKEAWLRSGFGVLAGLVGTAALVSLWHLFDGAAPSKEADYVYTQYFSTRLSWRFAAVYLVLGIALGWIIRRVSTG